MYACVKLYYNWIICKKWAKGKAATSRVFTCKSVCDLDERAEHRHGNSVPWWRKKEQQNYIGDFHLMNDQNENLSESQISLERLIG